MTQVLAPTIPGHLPADARQATWRWIHGPAVDVAVAFCWVPFTLLGLAWAGDPSRLAALMATTLVVSLSHQPLTLALVYGDPEQFGLRRRLFTWSPLVFLAAVVVGLHVNVLLVAAVAGLWNAVHTLFQRYGLTRVYGRKVGQADGALERAVLVSWLTVALLWAAADPATPHRALGLGLGATNERGIAVLGSLRPVATALLVVAVVVAAALVVAWVRAEARRPVVNRAKHVYLASTAALFVLVLVDPVAGLIGYVGSHAVEYLVTVHQHLGRRYQGDGADEGGTVGRSVRGPLGRTGVLVAYLVVVTGVLLALRAWSTPYAYTVVFLTAGGLHVFYDGFIWKLRRPQVARGFDLAER